jgi:hypothetical protein
MNILLSSLILEALLGAGARPWAHSTKSTIVQQVNSKRGCRFSHDMCVNPKSIKFRENFGDNAIVEIGVGQTLTSIHETDNCQGMATFTLDAIESNYSTWTVNANKNAPGTCFATFTGAADGSRKVGPKKLKVTIDPFI